MAPLPRSRRSLLSGMATILAAGLSGCSQDPSGYQVVLQNQSSSRVTGHLQVVTETDSTPVDEEVTLKSETSAAYHVSARPIETVLELARTSGRSRFNWDVPSCEMGGVPTQSLVVDGDSIGVDYGCNTRQ